MTHRPLTSRGNAVWLVALGGAAAGLFLYSWLRPYIAGARLAGKEAEVFRTLVCLLVAAALGKLAHTMAQLARAEDELAEHTRKPSDPRGPRRGPTPFVSHRLREIEIGEDAA